MKTSIIIKNIVQKISYQSSVVLQKKLGNLNDVRHLVSLILLPFLLITFNVNAQICTPFNTPQSVAPGNFDYFENGTVKDKLTGLTWQRCTYGQVWDNSNRQCIGSPIKLSWKNALTAANNEISEDFTSWRLPNIKELNSIYDYQCINPPINQTIFPNTFASTIRGYWSSTPHLDPEIANTINVWYIDLGLGQANYTLTTNFNFVKFVK